MDPMFKDISEGEDDSIANNILLSATDWDEEWYKLVMQSHPDVPHIPITMGNATHQVVAPPTCATVVTATTSKPQVTTVSVRTVPHQTTMTDTKTVAPGLITHSTSRTVDHSKVCGAEQNRQTKQRRKRKNTSVPTVCDGKLRRLLEVSKVSCRAGAAAATVAPSSKAIPFEDQLSATCGISDDISQPVVVTPAVPKSNESLKVIVLRNDLIRSAHDSDNKVDPDISSSNAFTPITSHVPDTQRKTSIINPYSSLAQSPSPAVSSVCPSPVVSPPDPSSPVISAPGPSSACLPQTPSLNVVSMGLKGFSNICIGHLQGNLRNNVIPNLQRGEAELKKVIAGCDYLLSVLNGSFNVNFFESQEVYIRSKINSLQDMRKRLDILRSAILAFNDSCLQL